MNKPTSPPIPWMGGKRSILPEILQRFPLRYDRFIEVFGGSGVVMFGKEPTAFEVWNDYNADLYNFYYCVKYRHLALLRELGFLPLTSRLEFGLMKRFLAGEVFAECDLAHELELAGQHFDGADLTELETLLTQRCMLGDISRAAAFFKLAHMSYGSGLTSFSSQPCTLRRFYEHIHAAHDRLEAVLLENKDFGEIIKQYDRDNSFFYLDPPYYKAEGCYAVEFPDADHVRLRELLGGIQGKFLLSYNDEPYIRELYQNFAQYRFTRTSNLVQRYEGGAEYGEILIANYELSERANANKQLCLF